MRVDLYHLVHKAQRFHLFGLARELSTADFSDPETRARLVVAVHDVVDLLDDHAQNEERYIHPLLASAGAAESIEHEHEAIAARLAELVALVDSDRWGEAYRCMMRFLGEYLLHIDEEERVQATILWPRYSDEELSAVLVRFKAERAPTAARADLALMLPALSVPELVRVMRAARMSAPRAAFEAMVDLARSRLGEQRWGRVAEALE